MGFSRSRDQNSVIAHAHLKRDLKEKAQAKEIKDLIDLPVSSTWLFLVGLRKYQVNT